MIKVDLVEAGLVPQDGGGPAWDRWKLPTDGRFACPSVGPYLLAAAVSDACEVSVWDEKVANSYTPRGRPDLVGISAKTMNINRAYALADALRAEGILVALGGVHASLLPREAAGHADAVVIGEADELWPELVRDAARGMLAPLYRAERRPAIENLPPQRSDLIPHGRYLVHSVQTSRGCSLDCEFCPTRQMFGEGFRLRAIDPVLQEVRDLLRAEAKPFFISDDIFGAGNPDYVATLGRELGKLSARFSFIADLKAFGPDLLADLARAGCFGICLNMPGTCTADEAAAIRHIRSLGIEVWGYFMFGFEFHTPDVFERCARFVSETGMEGVFLTLLAPYSGTPMSERLRAEERILTEDWRLYDQAHVVAIPRCMSPEELEGGYEWICETLEDRWGFLPIWRRAMARLEA